MYSGDAPIGQGVAFLRRVGISLGPLVLDRLVAFAPLHLETGRWVIREVFFIQGPGKRAAERRGGVFSRLKAGPLHPRGRCSESAQAKSDGWAHTLALAKGDRELTDHEKSGAEIYRVIMDEDTEMLGQIQRAMKTQVLTSYRERRIYHHEASIDKRVGIDRIREDMRIPQLLPTDE